MTIMHDALYSVLFRVFGKFGYGFGLQKNSPFTHLFSINVLELRQKGYMETMKSKWLTGTFFAFNPLSSTTIYLFHTLKPTDNVVFTILYLPIRGEPC